MEHNNRFSRVQPELRQDLGIWKRVSHNLKTISRLRQECQDVDHYIKDLSSRLEETNPDNIKKLSYKLDKAVKDGQALTSELKVKVQKTREDMVSLAKMGALGEQYSSNETESTSRQESDLSIDSVLPRQFPSNPIKKQRVNSMAPSKGHIPKGAMVAAKIPNTKDPAPIWILAVVVHYYTDRDKYLIEDVEADESDNQKHKYQLHSHHVIQIPHDKSLSYKKEFPPGHEVLALYPDTSCFYKAVIVSPPSKTRHLSTHPSYIVQFDDDDFFERAVQQTMVLNMPRDH